MWWSDIINQSLRNKFYINEVNAIQQSAYSPITSAHPMRSISPNPIQPVTQSGHPIVNPSHPVAQPGRLMIQPVNHNPDHPIIQTANHNHGYDIDDHGNVTATNTIHIEHTDTSTRQLDYVTPNPLAAGSLWLKK